MPAKVKSMSNVVQLVSRFGWFESVKLSFNRISPIVEVGLYPILNFSLVSIVCCPLVLALVLLVGSLICIQVRSPLNRSFLISILAQYCFFSPLCFRNCGLHFSSESVRVGFLLLLLVWLPSTRSLVVVPSLSLVLRSVDLGVASSSNRQCSPRYRSSELRASSLLWAPEYDGTAPQCVSSSHDRLDSWWGVLHCLSRNTWSALGGRFVL